MRVPELTFVDYVGLLEPPKGLKVICEQRVDPLLLAGVDAQPQPLR